MMTRKFLNRWLRQMYRRLNVVALHSGVPLARLVQMETARR